MLALTSPTGKLGAATLSSLLSQNLVPPTQLILLTSTPPTSPKFTSFLTQGIQIRQIDYKKPETSAFQGVTKLLLISTPEIKLDFNSAPTPQNPGRESVHISFLKRAVEAGVKHVFYTSLAFGGKSKAGVMRAHLRTEEFLHSVEEKGEVGVTILREGLYNESWPLYLGYFTPGIREEGDEREEVVLAGDGKVCWTSIADLGLGTALILSVKAEEFKGRTVYLSSGPEGARTLKEIAGLVGEARARELRVKIVSRGEYVRYYVEERGSERESVEWWSSTYEALEERECLVDDTTLRDLLKERGVELKKVEETVEEMMPTSFLLRNFSKEILHHVTDTQTIALHYPPATGPDGKTTYFPAFIEHFGNQRIPYEHFALLQQQPPAEGVRFSNPGKTKELNAFFHYKYTSFCKETNANNKSKGIIGRKIKEAEWVRLLVKFLEKFDEENMSQCIGKKEGFGGYKRRGLGFLTPEGSQDWRLTTSIEEVWEAKKKLFRNKVYEIKDDVAMGHCEEFSKKHPGAEIVGFTYELEPENNQNQANADEMEGAEMSGVVQNDLMAFVGQYQQDNEGMMSLAFRPR